ncbi:condensation domain-containing protein [Amycolatopsis thailandensis]|uniref:condensation domain-containing protein n=1 Tax=Amycolatopsis thailandensis TaxID=589330 RepID=UPI00364328F0
MSFSPLTQVQRAYWAGQYNARPGAGACHFSVEYDCAALDLDRYEAAWRKVIGRHPMLRTVVTPFGYNLTFDRVPDYRIRRHALQHLEAPLRERKLRALRERISRRVPRHDRWPLLCIEAALLPDGVTRLFVGVDVLVCDVVSFSIAHHEVRRFCSHVDKSPPMPRVTFAQYVDEVDRSVPERERERARRYWLSRLEDLPDRPALPSVERPGPVRFHRLEERLDAGHWTAIKRRAGSLNVTPTAFLLAVYAEVLGEWSSMERFVLALTRHERKQVHPTVDGVIGDFRTLLIHEVDRATQGRFDDRVRATHRRLSADLEHETFSGVEVLAEKSVHAERPFATPVMFTEAIDHASDLDDGEWLGKRVHEMSRTPGIVLDHRVEVRRDACLVQWDILVSEIDIDSARRAFDRYVRRLREETAPHR